MNSIRCFFSDSYHSLANGASAAFVRVESAARSSVSCVSLLARELLRSASQDVSKKPGWNSGKVVIIGSGPAGYTAAIYAARAHLHPVVYEGSFTGEACPGGQLMTTTKIENYPGFPEGIEGPVLMDQLRQQALNLGATLLEEEVTDADLSKHPFTVRGERTVTQAAAVIVATGARVNRPDIPGMHDGELWQRGVSACAVCDGALPLFRDRPVCVVGGGDTAMEEALFLSRFASKVFVVHRRDRLRASKVLQKAALENPKVQMIWNSVISRVKGEDVVKSVVLKNVLTGQESEQEAAGVFLAIGHTPNTSFLRGQLKLDSQGCIQVTPGSSRTSVPYVYAAGDVTDSVYRQAITAAASGCMAVMDAERDLE